MSFKIGMLSEAVTRKIMLVFDKSRMSFAKPVFDYDTEQFALYYLDGGVALLFRNTFNQMEPCELHLVPTREQFEEREAWFSGRKVIPLGSVMFGSDLIPDLCREEGRSGSLAVVNGELACLACEV